MMLFVGQGGSRATAGVKNSSTAAGHSASFRRARGKTFMSMVSAPKRRKKVSCLTDAPAPAPVLAQHHRPQRSYQPAAATLP